MTAPQKRAHVVVVGIDFSDTGNLALDRAFAMASDEKNGEVHVINVARGYGPMVHLDTGGDIETVSLEEASRRLKHYVEERLEAFVNARAKESKPVFERAITHLRLDSPAEEIAQLASDLEADVVVVGTHGRRGFRRLLLGSVAEGVVRLAPCAVLVVRPQEDAGPVPEIEPPCPRCVAAREASDGKELWCDQHREGLGRRHTYHYLDRNVQARESIPLVTR